jgi:uncharacterized damage-inducible protein DinB
VEPDMSIAQLLLPEFDAEMEITRRLVERVPEGKPDWKPHAKSMALARLATHVTEIPGWLVWTFEKDELDISPPGAPKYEPQILHTTAALLAQFDGNVAKGRAALAAAADDTFTRPWTFQMGGKSLWTKPKFEVYRSFGLNHLVHHRSQLGVYLRLLDVAIPGTYGPSADEMMG